MKDEKLVELICEYCSEINDFGYVIVPNYNLQEFAKKLPLECERSLECAIMQDGYISIHIDELQRALCLCDDTKEEITNKLKLL